MEWKKYIECNKWEIRRVRRLIKVREVKKRSMKEVMQDRTDRIVKEIIAIKSNKIKHEVEIKKVNTNNKITQANNNNIRTIPIQKITLKK